MADTTSLRQAFDWVRGELAREIGTAVGKQPVSLTTGAERTFNAVSADGRLVAQIVNSSGATSGGKRPVGKIQAALARLYLLVLVEAPERRLVVTDSEFYDFVANATHGALAPGLRLQLGRAAARHPIAGPQRHAGRKQGDGLAPVDGWSHLCPAKVAMSDSPEVDPRVPLAIRRCRSSRSDSQSLGNLRGGNGRILADTDG